jgi:ABC-type nitrate/sulfonate/bicarbonate transport system permease component
VDYLERDRGASTTELAHPGLSGSVPDARRLLRPGVRVVPVIVAVVLLGLWEGGVHVGAIDPLLFTAPSTIAATSWRLLGNGVLLGHIGATALRVGSAVLIGGCAGLLLGVAMGSSPRMRIAIDPFIGAFHPVPKIAVLPLIMVIFGIGNVSLIIVIATGAFFPMVINSMAGVTQIHPVHHDVAALYGAGPSMRLRRVIIPGAAPSVLAGLRLALNTALLIAVAVEMIAARQGLGSMIWMSWTTLRTEEIYVAIGVTIAFGIAVNGAISLITRIAVPWERPRSG